jgi:RIO kinase 1
MIEDKDPKGRSERASATSSRGPKHDRGRSVASAVVAEDPLRRGPPEFAANVQVTNTEREWIREYLGKFYKDELILDVVRRIKAGKEATVYACTGHPSTGREIIAAKLYRERSLRSTKNTGQYHQGRALLDGEGKAAKQRSGRPERAVTQSTKRGKAATQTSWIMHEFTLLQSMHAQGGDVPEAIGHADQALLMEFFGEGLDAAPTLNDVELESTAEAKQLFERVLFNIDLLLGLGWVHGDLSAYNILYHRGRIVLIDFPQVADCQNNPRARSIFDRDVERVTQYFGRFGCDTDHRKLAQQLWSKHVAAPTPEDMRPEDLEWQDPERQDPERQDSEPEA